jgi:hypothetical protein
MPTTSAVRVASWSVLAVLFAAVTACSSRAAPVDDSAAPRPVEPAAVAVAVDPDRQAVLTAYAGYLDAETTASQQADYGSVELTRFMAQPLLGQWVAQLYHLHAIGYKQLGAVVSAAPKLTSLTVTTSKGSGTATVTDCLDETAMSIVKVSNGAPMALPKHNSRYQATATLHLADGMWRVSEVDADRSRTC